MFDAALDGSFKGIYIEGEDIAQSDPNTHHVAAALQAMEIVVVQDIFLNETAKYAHVFLPGSSFLEKNGTFTNCRAAHLDGAQGDAAAGRQGRLGESPACCPTRSAIRWSIGIRREIMDEIARLTPTFAGVSYDKLDRLGSVQWPCNDERARRHARDACRRVRARQGQLHADRVRPDRRAHRPALSADPDHRDGCSRNTTSARRRGAPRTSCGIARIVLEIHPHDAEQRGIRDGDWVEVSSRDGAITLRALLTERVPPGVVYTTFHHPETGTNVVTTENSDWATNCPEYKVTAVQVMPLPAGRMPERRGRPDADARTGRGQVIAETAQWTFIIWSKWRIRSATSSPRIRIATEVIGSIAQHLRNSWDPRMRRQIVEYVNQTGARI